MSVLRSRKGCICLGIGEVLLACGILGVIGWCRCRWRHWMSNRKCKCECHEHDHEHH